MVEIWPQGNKTVTMTKEHAEGLVAAIVAALGQRQQASDLDQYKLLARTEADLAQAQAEIVRQRGEINALRSHINNLNNVLSTMTPGSGYPASTNGNWNPTTSQKPYVPETIYVTPATE